MGRPERGAFKTMNTACFTTCVKWQVGFVSPSARVAPLEVHLSVIDQQTACGARTTFISQGSQGAELSVKSRQTPAGTRDKGGQVPFSSVGRRGMRKLKGGMGEFYCGFHITTFFDHTLFFALALLDEDGFQPLEERR